MEQLLRSILALEDQARETVAAAERRSQEVVQEAVAERSALERQAERDAAQGAQRIVAAAAQEAEQARGRILAGAEEQARFLAERAGPRLEGAIHDTVEAILHRAPMGLMEREPVEGAGAHKGRA